MRVNAYADVNPKGFGLMQRQRDFGHTGFNRAV